uniref:Putative secreted protein n=1 Tax=Ixodes ricinus TaxID=34613 RepID=A0A6B0V4S6_IXORI
MLESLRIIVASILLLEVAALSQRLEGLGGIPELLPGPQALLCHRAQWPVQDLACLGRHIVVLVQDLDGWIVGDSGPQLRAKMVIFKLPQVKLSNGRVDKADAKLAASPSSNLPARFCKCEEERGHGVAHLPVVHAEHAGALGGDAADLALHHLVELRGPRSRLLAAILHHLRSLCLLHPGHLVALLDQALRVAAVRDLREPRVRKVPLHVHQSQLLHSGDGIHVVQLVELAHLEEEHNVEMLRLHVPPLLHSRREF